MWTWNVAHVKQKFVQKFKPEVKRKGHLRSDHVYRLLKWILLKQVLRMRTGELCEPGNEPSGSIGGAEFRD
jgi:hypothetical protein